MYSVWTKNIHTAEEKEQFKNSLRGSKWVLDRQHEILIELETALDRAETNPKTYDLPNWDYRQAHNNGYRQCLNLIKNLINLDQKDVNDPRQLTAG